MTRALIHIFALLSAIAVLWPGPGAEAQERYLLQPGDVLSVEVLEDSSLNRQTFVLPDGRISFPLVGTISAAGRTLSQVQANLRTALSPNFAAPPTVFLSIAQLAPRGEAPVAPPPELITVFVTGEVGAAGPKQVEAGTRVLQFLATTGGFTRFAATKRIQLRRTDAHGTMRTFLINYRAVERGVDVRNNFVLQDGDLLIAPTRRLFE